MEHLFTVIYTHTKEKLQNQEERNLNKHYKGESLNDYWITN